MGGGAPLACCTSSRAGPTRATTTSSPCSSPPRPSPASGATGCGTCSPCSSRSTSPPEMWCSARVTRPTPCTWSATGAFGVDREEDATTTLVTEAGPGTTVGEAELSPAPSGRRPPGPCATRWCCASHDGLARATRWHPELPIRLARPVLRRAGQAAGPAPAPPPAVVGTLAVVPAGRSRLPEGFVEELARALEPLGGTAVLTSAAVDRAVGAGTAELSLADPRNGRVVEWLQRRERSGQTGVYVADEGPTSWTRRCARPTACCWWPGPGTVPASGPSSRSCSDPRCRRATPARSWCWSTPPTTTRPRHRRPTTGGWPAW